MSTKRMAGRFLRTTMLSGFAAAAAMPVLPAVAQDADAAEDDRIVVTGSRIARPDLASPSPLTTVDAASLAINNTVNTEDFLNDLPQLIPSFDPRRRQADGCRRH